MQFRGVQPHARRARVGRRWVVDRLQNRPVRKRAQVHMGSHARSIVRVDEAGERVVQNDHVSAGPAGDGLGARGRRPAPRLLGGPGHGYAVQVVLARVGGRGRDVQMPALLVDAVEAVDLPPPRRERANLAAVRRVQVQVAKASLLARPEEPSRKSPLRHGTRDRPQHVVQVNPRVARLGVQEGALPCGRIEAQHAQHALLPVLDLRDEVSPGQPLESRQVLLLAGAARAALNAHPNGRPRALPQRRQGRHSQPHVNIVRSGERIWVVLVGIDDIRFAIVHNAEEWHVACVYAREGDAAAILAPLETAGPVHLLL
mmetsp:Transcript_49746/g.158884  ORF Transcript_49746/g.158884 Transcript_49746/m.158884 type:complete len:315 (+) Transcript_49746:838-1782(+)